MTPLEMIKQVDDKAENIAYTWNQWNTARAPKLAEWKELQSYIFATDTSTTSNSGLPWSSTVTTPKLTQIRDNLHANYYAGLFPNENWLKWQGYTVEENTKEKAKAITGFMANRFRESGGQTVISRSLLDYIDYGNAFGLSEYISRKYEIDGDIISGYVGPRTIRVSPLDIVFNPTANSFKETPKIIRSLKSIGELYAMAEDNPDNIYLKRALKSREDIFKHASMFGWEDIDKSAQSIADGFGSLEDYYTSNTVELLQFFGDWSDAKTGQFERRRLITIVDRKHVIQDESIPNWLGEDYITHAGWRKRPDSLWAMGPLDNLVGMQYLIDHLQNARADAISLAINPPRVIKGEVEEYEYGPNSEILLDENGEVTELGKNLSGVIQAEGEVQALEARMELYAGAPREAMGVRTAGEKTAYEVQSLENAAGRIFQEKLTQFEQEFLEPTLQNQFELSKRLMDGVEMVRIIDEKTSIELIKKITKEDLTASGKLRPVGARHFAANAQLLQNIAQTLNGPLAQIVGPHTSGINLAKLIEEVTNTSAYKIFGENKGVQEQQGAMQEQQAIQEDFYVNGGGSPNEV